VIDGDTVDIEYQNGTEDTARLLGVDSPETSGGTNPDEFEGVPDTEAGRSCLSKWAEKATDYTRSRLEGATVTITFDDNEPRRGFYDRLLVYIQMDDGLFNYNLVSQGYARVYTDSQFTKESSFLSAEDDAQGAHTGLWECQNPPDRATPTPTPTPTETPSGSGELTVRSIQADAPGNDNENVDEEYVVFENTGGGTLDISGWVVEDEADHTYTVPSGTTVEPGETVALYTGSSGSDAGADISLYWGSGSAIWNNGGDTVIVRTEDGKTVLEYEYSE
jgi:micrococcal nuclease